MEDPEIQKQESINAQPPVKSVSHEPLFGFLVMMIIVLCGVALASYGGWILYHGVRESRGDSSRVSIERIPLATNMEEQQKKPKEMEEPKNVENTEVKTDSTVANKKISVKVMNGGAVKGSASVVAGVLMGSGYSTVGTGNATGDYTGVTVYFTAPATEADANAVKVTLLPKYPSSTVKPSVVGTADTLV
ncbi:MAG: LytR C-terminal domain-containing protein, partial [Candidatus Moraniibacteriota bacterium]